MPHVMVRQILQELWLKYWCKIMFSISLLEAVEQKVISSINGGRIDYDSPTTIVWHPYVSGYIGLYTGESWTLVTPSPTSSGIVSFDLTTDTDIRGNAIAVNTQYDVYARYLSADNFKLDLVSWSAPNHRGYTTGLQDNIFVHGTDHTRRYLGVVRTISDSGPKFVDSDTQRFVCNFTNRIMRYVRTYNSGTGDWTPNSSGGWKEFNFGTNQVRGEFLYLRSDEVLLGADQGLSPNVYTGSNNSLVALALNENSALSMSPPLYVKSGRNSSNSTSFPTGFFGSARLGYNYITELISTYVSNPFNTGGGLRSGGYLIIYV